VATVNVDLFQAIVTLTHDMTTVMQSSLNARMAPLWLNTKLEHDSHHHHYQCAAILQDLERQVWSTFTQRLKQLMRCVTNILHQPTGEQQGKGIVLCAPVLGSAIRMWVIREAMKWQLIGHSWVPYPS